MSVGHRPEITNPVVLDHGAEVMKSVKTWLLVADGTHARIFESRSGQHGLSEVDVFDRSEEANAARSAHIERLGRVFDSYGLGRHAMEPRRQLGEVEEHRFVEEILQELSQDAYKNLFDRLVIIAPPVTLGRFRKAMPKQLQHVLAETMNKDLTGLTTPQLEDYLKSKHSDLL